MADGWTPTGGGGYRHTNGATVSRQSGPRGGKGDFILRSNGQSLNLGKKATFQSLANGLAKLGKSAGAGKAGSGKSG